MGIFQEEIAEKIWDINFRCRQKDSIQDHTVLDTWRRVATAVAGAEQFKNRAQWTQAFTELLSDFKFLPGVGILAGAGSAHKVSLYDSFVMPLAEDSLSGIFDALKEAALTLQQGGRLGCDFSPLRPHGSPAQHAGVNASGPVPFMHVWDAMSATIAPYGGESGAMMAVLRCDHPDIQTFIAAKADSPAFNHFHLSVLLSDSFMQAVKENREWELLFPAGEEGLTDTVLRHWGASPEPVACRVVNRVPARELWKQIIHAGSSILFEDAINRFNNLWYREWISAASPCGAIPLPVYGGCAAGSLNLTQFVSAPFTNKASPNWAALDSAVTVATRFLDNVVDVSHFPLSAQRKEALATRRIGLGVTGLADMLVMLGLSYGSEAAIVFAGGLMQRIAEVTWQSSVALAQEKGVFAAFHGKKYVQGHFVARLSSDIRQLIEKHGIRNSHHNTVVPAATVSLFANNVSRGIEPVYASYHERSVKETTGVETRYRVTDYALKRWEQGGHEQSLPPAWVDADSLRPEQHLSMQTVVQSWVDHGVSKHIILGGQVPFEQLEALFIKAYQQDLKAYVIAKME